jgi:hypothetical protein
MKPVSVSCRPPFLFNGQGASKKPVTCHPAEATMPAQEYRAIPSPRMGWFERIFNFWLLPSDINSTLYVNLRPGRTFLRLRQDTRVSWAGGLEGTKRVKFEWRWR